MCKCAVQLEQKEQEEHVLLKKEQEEQVLLKKEQEEQKEQLRRASERVH